MKRIPRGSRLVFPALAFFASARVKAVEPPPAEVLANLEFFRSMGILETKIETNTASSDPRTGDKSSDGKETPHHEKP